ncbi:MAG: hypothetical protein NTU95_09365 [Methanothrix sp.]|nr:hypothetical protein [Methanothrix sp.]
MLGRNRGKGLRIHPHPEGWGLPASSFAILQVKTIKYRDVDYETAKKEVMGYFQERGEAYPSDIEDDLELDYKLICQIVEELKREGRLEVL